MSVVVHSSTHVLGNLLQATGKIDPVVLDRSIVNFDVGADDQFVTTQRLRAAEFVIDAQFSPGVETAKDLVSCMEKLWRIAKQV